MKGTLKPQHLLSDFENIKKLDNVRKILIIGEKGIGKSSILNKLYGCRMIQDPNDKHNLVFDSSSVSHPFETGHDDKVITQQTEFVINHLFSRKENPFYMLIDMPGTMEDLDEDLLLQDNLNDLTSKLKTLGPITGVLVMIDSEDYKNAIEVGKEDYINDSVMTILMAIQVIYQEADPDFSMNLAFGLSKCDNNRKETWGKLKDHKEEVIQAIFDDLQENGVQATHDKIHLYYLSSQEEEDEYQMTQEQEFLNMLNFFESCFSNSPQPITLPTASSIQAMQPKNKPNISNKLSELNEAEKESEGTSENENINMNDIEKKIKKMRKIIEKDEINGESLKIVFSKEKHKNLSFWKKLFEADYFESAVPIEKVETQGVEVLSGGEGSNFCKFNFLKTDYTDGNAYIRGWSKYKNFESYQNLMKDRRSTLEDLEAYRAEILERNS